jgi:amphi-Trp domain-containing protein
MGTGPGRHPWRCSCCCSNPGLTRQDLAKPALIAPGAPQGCRLAIGKLGTEAKASAFVLPALPHAEMERTVMTLDKIKKRLTRAEAADQLAQLVQELRDGRISLGRKARRLPPSDELEFSAKFEEDRLEVELKWDT